MGQLKSELDDTNKKLEQQTKRWMEWRDQVQETIQNVKSSNAKRIEAMKLKHSKDMATEIFRLSLSNSGRIGFTPRRLLLRTTNWRPWINPTSKCAF